MAASDDLLTRKATLTAEIAAGPTKPSYSLAGQSVDWPTYRKWLFEELAEINKALQAEMPFEIRTVIFPANG